MPNISKITLPNNLTYDIKDAAARNDISSIQAVIGTLTGANVVIFRGVSSTTLTDGGTQNPTINGSAVTTKRTGDVYFYGTEEFIWGSDSKWHALGSLDTLGRFAYISAISGDSTEQFVKNISTTSLDMNNLTSKVRAHYPEYDENYYGLTANQATGTMQPTKHIYSWSYSGSGGQTFTNTEYGYQPEGNVSTINGSSLVIKSIQSYNSDNDANNTVIIYNKTPNTTEAGISTYTPTGTITLQYTSPDSSNYINVTQGVTVAAPGVTAPSNNLTYYNYDSTNETLKLYQIGYIIGRVNASFSGNEKKFYANPILTSSEITNKLRFEGTPVYFEANGTPTGTVTPTVLKDTVRINLVAPSHSS